MDLLRVWETSQSQSSAQQALLLLAAAHPEQSWDMLSQLSVGQRDSLLLTLRQQLFGNQLACVAECPQCQDRLEINLEVTDLQAPSPPVASPLRLAVAEYDILFRLPTGGDLVAIAQTENDAEQAQQNLLHRCLLTVHHHGKPTTAPLPNDLVDRLIEAIATQDPQADVQLDLSCPNCQHLWQLGFDIASFLQGELQVWAQRLFQDVHRLARAYGWSEADIVAMSPRRRQLYVEMASYG
jgi:hypothetical protein